VKLPELDEKEKNLLASWEQKIYEKLKRLEKQSSGDVHAL